jgi:hypothetical protein
MLAEFAQFVKEVFPSITPETAKQLIEKAGLGGLTDEQFFATQLGDKLCQGDIVEGLRWIVERDDGSYGRTTAPGMLLSHSCDVDNDEWLTFAPCAAFHMGLRKAREIRRNEVFDIYYMPPHQGRPPLIADLAQVQAMRAGRVLAGIASGAYRRTETLTTLGYYHFVLKLTLHYLRPQSAEELRYTCKAPLVERLGYAAIATGGLVRYVARGSSTG